MDKIPVLRNIDRVILLALKLLSIPISLPKRFSCSNPTYVTSIRKVIASIIAIWRFVLSLTFILFN